MKHGLQTTFNEPVGVPTMQDVAARRFTMARIDVMQVTDLSGRVALTEEALHARLAPLVIVADASQVGGLPPVDVELRNEPDGRVSPAEYAGLVLPFVQACRAQQARPWIGAISNLHRSALEWLDAMLREVPRSDIGDTGISVHRYPNGKSWRDPHSGFTSRTSEVDALRAIIGSRAWGVSEFGYHTAPQRHPEWWRRWWPAGWPGARWRWTDDQVLENVRAEWEFWRTQNAAFAVLYQIVDGGDPNNAEDRFGIRRLDGTWKPVAESVPA